MEYETLRKLTHKTIKKALVTGLVGLVLTVGATTLAKNSEDKTSVAAAGLFMSYLASGYQFFRARKEFY